MPALRRLATLAAGAALAAGAVGCGSGVPTASPASPLRGPAQAAQASVVEIDETVAAWATATSVEQAHAAAERARNQVVGDDNPLYGDADGDGTLSGATTVGLLPGIDGRPGLASRAPNACVEADLLGGSWADAPERWAILDRAIAAYRPDDNPFPTLPSHAQRVVGWATLALAADDLDEIHGYAGHAGLHSRVIRDAVADCA